MKNLAIILLLVCGTAHAAEPQVLRDYFDPKVIIKDKAAVYHGEMLQKHVGELTIGQQLPESASVSYRELQSADDKAAYAITVAWGSNVQDFYAFLVHESGVWKISAIRSRIFIDAMYKLANTIQASGNKSREEWLADGRYKFLMILKSDAELKDHLKSNLPELNKLVSLLQQGKEEEAQAQAKSIFLTGVTLRFPDKSSPIDMQIVRLENFGTLGYMYASADVKPPAVSQDRYIYLERVVENWYVYKKIRD